LNVILLYIIYVFLEHLLTQKLS